MMGYFDTPIAAIAVNLKVASSSLARAIIRAHHPEEEAMLHTRQGEGERWTEYPEGRGPENTRWQSVCPKVEPEERESIFLLVRDPVERFRSACAEREIQDVSGLLDRLESGQCYDPHFAPQSQFAGEGVRVYRYPDQLEELARDAGLEHPLPEILGPRRPKPELTQEQEARVKRIYSEDFKLC
jgi:hypothetical protein